jgi:cytoskeleton protein RodZ
MTDDTQTVTETTDAKRIPFGKRLKSARETLGLERKDAAAQLHLNEKVIIMMENDRYPADLPITFIRGYLRSYAKLLQIPDYEIKQAIEPIKPKPSHLTPAAKLAAPLTSTNWYVQFFTYLIVFTMAGLLGVWWYTHSMPNFSMIANSNLLSSPSHPPTEVSVSNPNNPTDATAPSTLTEQGPSITTQEIMVAPIENAAKTENNETPNQPLKNMHAAQNTEENVIENNDAAENDGNTPTTEPHYLSNHSMNKHTNTNNQTADSYTD